ncbi:hypothetical protein C8Q75DRAFT_810959 [Abortiporus biennis]|nr:hypothetical protein C8Q75DRAFT_810959 [Abortiporus biennis]
MAWNYTIDDTSSILTYRPYSDGIDPNDGWVSWFSMSGFRTDGTGGSAYGDSRHLTSLTGSSVSLEFHGTSIYLYGNSSCPFDVSLDNDVSSLSNSTSSELLYSTENLTIGTHFIQITVRPSAEFPGQLFFDKAIVTDMLPSSATSVTPVPIDNQNMSSLHYGGQWTTGNNAHIPSPSNPKPFRRTTVSGASVALNFTGAIAVAINGDRDMTHQTYQVSLDGVSQNFNASTFWFIGDAVLYYRSGLDPNVTHSISMINGAGNEPHLSLNDFTLYIPSMVNTSSSSIESYSPTKKHNAGAVVGGVFVAVIGLVAMTIAFVIFRRKHMKEFVITALFTRHPDSDISPYTLYQDDTTNTSQRPAGIPTKASEIQSAARLSDRTRRVNPILSASPGIPIPANLPPTTMQQYIGQYSLPTEAMGPNVQAMIILTRANDQDTTLPPYQET